MRTRKNTTKKQDHFVTINDQSITVSEDVYRIIRQEEWRISKQVVRGRRCRDENGNRCKKKCSECPHFQNGNALSLDRLIADGMEPVALEDVSEEAIKNDLITAMKSEISRFDTISQRILWLFGDGLTEREIAEKLGLSPTTVHYRKHKLFKELYRQLKHFN